LSRSTLHLDVEHIFSCGHLLISHIRNRLTGQISNILLCVGLWRQLGLVRDKDIQSVMSLSNVNGKCNELDDG
ncbi:hypothetical protein CY34DRAFT_34892, partial [Suillus luteus UH-Slu-Lm8-n1]